VTTRTVVLTGAASGLGAALARHFAEEPNTNLVAADIDEDALAATVAELPADVVAVRADVGDPDAVRGLVDTALDRFGRLDVMINNAGALSSNARLHNLTPADWERALRINLMGVVHGITAAVRVMRPQGGGAIVSTASVAGMMAFPYAAPYCAAKAAIIEVTKVAAVEYARDGIRVNCVCPGAFASRMHAGQAASALEALGDRQPLGWGAPEDVVGAFAYLAGEESRWTTGSAVVVDGGFMAR
jgi:NAD(P)-dependent dehydrogenase (short-subunit alcohol dehydrogenase family)